MLSMGFTLPVTDDEVPEDVFNTSADFDLGTVADEAGGGTTVADDILETIHKGFLRLEGVHVADGQCKSPTNS